MRICKRTRLFHVFPLDQKKISFFLTRFPKRLKFHQWRFISLVVMYQMLENWDFAADSLQHSLLLVPPLYPPYQVGVKNSKRTMWTEHALAT